MTLQDYIKLAESATDGPWKKGWRHDSDFIEDNDKPCGCVQKGDGSFFVASITANSAQPNYNDATFIAASRTLGPAMAKALIEAEEALRQIRTGCHPEFNVNRIADKALDTIQALQESKNEQ